MLLLSSLALAGHQTETVVVTIDAAPAVVWAVLTDFEDYSAWNPWIIEASGEAVEGGTVAVTSVLNGREQQVDHAVTLVSPTDRFCWKDTGWFTIFARGQRCRSLTPVDGGTRLTVELTLRGAMVGTVERRYGDAIRAGMRAEADALAARAEAGGG